MDIYKVGGCVRDKLLGIDSKDRDWVVVGASPEQLQQQGYVPVGKHFPVFLHPETKEEYALARTERKTAPGYTGFEFHATPDVTLDQDLQRRDLTINAMAEDKQGRIIDPYHGQQDLEQRILRHVSPAFVEDPLRVLRVARFAARFTRLGFTLADETLQVMKQIAASGELDALVAERVWQELQRSLAEDNPEIFFQVLKDSDALAIIFPQIHALFGIPQPEQYHPEIDTGIHTMMVLQQAVRLSSQPEVRFAALVHDLGKALTPKQEWPKHVGHEQRGIEPVKALCKRYKIPKTYTKLAVLVTKFHLHYHRIEEMRPATILKCLQSLDAFRRPQRFEQFMLACEADSRGRTGMENNDYVQPGLFRNYFQAANNVDIKSLTTQGLRGEDFARALQTLRLQAITHIRKPSA